MKYSIDELSVEERNYMLDLHEHIKTNRLVREDGLSSIEVVIKSMIDNKWKKFWRASDFLYGDCFVGYETTSIMSRAIKKYPNLFKVTKAGRFRCMGLNWEDREDLPSFIEKFSDLPKFEFNGEI